ncbi:MULTISPECIES: STAS domain-containing protein [Thalassotalea]|uniref:STAS domain-containing protein n=1 Tax=Thalassotalea TaxID=1518149 RepID=UPI00094211B3|nr:MULTISPECIES: STAS domain-containing protein [Thalassotalea]OKY26763.1 hypothetical protein BI291_01860 [Thalassotalea sp. PP2-459]
MNAAPKVSYQNLIVLLEVNKTFTFAHHQTVCALKRICRQQTTHIDIDFKNTLYIDSAGLGMLLILKNFCRKNQILLRIFNATRGNTADMLTMIDLLPSVENMMSSQVEPALTTAYI